MIDAVLPIQADGQGDAMSEITYASTADELVRRIVALIPAHPEILALESAWGLFKIPGFQCSDLAPSLYQASWALARAKAEYSAALPSGEQA